MKEPIKRGRPKQDDTRTASQRVRDADTALIERGGKIFRTLRLSPEAGQAFDELRANFETDKAVIEHALLFFCDSQRNI